ncbi:organ-specific protein P4 [Ziziphus jujuba]|uniref:Organ-specific protein P4 n=1 Tax=Ziziphus jujuba TaxID=326968 RepID=A0A6P4ACD8_ZIZJJ|nr:organ-specific protein P4 [Ziziphus jujuba]
MKSLLPFLCILLSLLLFTNLSFARKDIGDYWKSIMKEQPMPEAIRDLFHQEDVPSLPGSRKMDRFARDFDIRPNLIIYHAHPKPVEGKTETEDEEEFKVIKQINRG